MSVNYLPSYAEVKAMSTEELQASFDGARANVAPSFSFWREMMMNREASEGAAAAMKLNESVRSMTGTLTFLTWVIGVCTVVMTFCSAASTYYSYKSYHLTVQQTMTSAQEQVHGPRPEAKRS